MKKLFFALAFTAGVAFTASAQKTVSIGVQGGLNLATVQESYSGNSSSSSPGNLTDFSAGLFAKFDLSSSVALQPGVFYSGKGYHYKSTVQSATLMAFAEEKTKISYQQVPVDLLYSLPAGPGKFFIGGGPFVAVAVKAHEKGSGTYATTGIYNTVSNYQTQTDVDLIIGGSNGDIKRLDYGINALAGYKLNNGLLLNVSYDFGLANISEDSSAKIRTRVLGISVGYAFM